MSLITDADQAKRLLDDEFFQRVLNELREDTKARMMQTKPRDNELREELYFEFHAVRRFEERLKTFYDRKTFLQKR